MDDGHLDFVNLYANEIIRRQCIIRIDEYGFTYISMNVCKYRSVLKEDYATSENMRWNMFKVWLDKRVSVKWSNLDWSSGTRYTKA